jgi:hypothetical protein
MKPKTSVMQEKEATAQQPVSKHKDFGKIPK